ncbi:MAG: 50S ribosomal protein L9 [Anaerolineae bacterium]|nr:50S ribosomal protein L9 [Anaerolineae bacterium]
MKVLLIEDVDNLGYAGDVKNVANGYGRNYLIPQKMAVIATPGALRQSDTIRKVAEKRRAQETSDAQAIANQIAGLELVFERRAGDMGKLYGSVTSGDIAEAIEAKTSIALDKRKVALPEPIRTLTEQEVVIKLMIDVKTTVKVEVLPLGGILERSRLAEAEAAKAARATPPAEEPVEVEAAVVAEPEAPAEPTEDTEAAVVEPTDDTEKEA